ncbi:MAG TPA: SpoVR family protein [Azospirillaceae bacterium]|nr:SpoVR family protein [Azospirillaceae bacterium]
MTLLYEGADWDFEKLKRAYDAIEGIALGELGLDIYPNQIEVITAEQMLDAYASNGMPLMYRHWSFGKHFAQNETLYRKGYQGLAYEIVINSNPCIAYIMEENTMTMQALVVAHACFGHNHFFKNNHLFREWTDADGLLDYLGFAKEYISRCEERYGLDAVERVLDAAHALSNQGVHRYARRPKLSLVEERKRQQARLDHEQQVYNPIWSTVPAHEGRRDEPQGLRPRSDPETRAKLNLPEENLLYFLEKHAPKMKDWEREILRIVRLISQYYYPQKQTKLMNEGCATFVHYEIMTRLHERGQISDGNYLEFLHSHTNVIYQPLYDSKYYSGINPYALGFAMMQDIKRICLDPTDEDRAWLPDIAGNGDPYGTLREAWANYRDESFVLQFLTPKVIRDFRLFAVSDQRDEPELEVSAIHDEEGYRRIRRALARHYETARREPDIQVTDADIMGDRRLVLSHTVHDGITLNRQHAERVLTHVRDLWGYPVRLTEVDAKTGAPLGILEARGS